MASLSLPPPRKAAAATPQVVAPPRLEPEEVDDDGTGEDSNRTTTTTASRHQHAAAATTTAPATGVPQPPPSYEERCRAAAQLSQMTAEQRRRSGQKLFVPRSLRDFADGGAFPEIHVAQYPRHLGNPHLNKRKPTAAASGAGGSGSVPNAASSSRALTAVKTVEVNADGKVSYDSIVTKSGTNRDKLVYSRHADLVGIGGTDQQDVALPSQQQEEEETARTNAALQALLASKTALDKPAGSALAHAATSKNIEEQTQFIQYTPNPDAPGYNPAAAQRVIQMVPAQVDPMMPPKHKHLKAPRGPAEDPVPVLHAPPSKKLSAEEKAAWNIPSSISNWKNMRGYTIPLDKRLAADGRGAREPASINANFATLSESLYVAERQARQEVRMRATVQKQLALQEKEARETELRQLAQQARLQRGGAATTTPAAAAEDSDDSDLDNDHDDNDDVESITPVPKEQQPDGAAAGAGAGGTASVVVPADDHDLDQDETEDQVAARQRETMRRERKREREREWRVEHNAELSAAATAAKQQQKKQRLEEDRDVSEQIALGVHTGTGGADGGDGQVDSRLYNQSSGMNAGFGRDDEYNAYSQPLFNRGAGASSSSIYRPTRGDTAYNADEQYAQLQQSATTKFQPDQGFAGAQGGGGSHPAAAARTAPVQFERGDAQKKNTQK